MGTRIDAFQPGLSPAPRTATGDMRPAPGLRTPKEPVRGAMGDAPVATLDLVGLGLRDLEPPPPAPVRTLGNAVSEGAPTLSRRSCACCCARCMVARLICAMRGSAPSPAVGLAAGGAFDPPTPGAGNCGTPLTRGAVPAPAFGARGPVAPAFMGDTNPTLLAAAPAPPLPGRRPAVLAREPFFGLDRLEPRVLTGDRPRADLAARFALAVASGSPASCASLWSATALSCAAFSLLCASYCFDRIDSSEARSRTELKCCSRASCSANRSLQSLAAESGRPPLKALSSRLSSSIVVERGCDAGEPRRSHRSPTPPTGSAGPSRAPLPVQRRFTNTFIAWTPPCAF